MRSAFCRGVRIGAIGGEEQYYAINGTKHPGRQHQMEIIFSYYTTIILYLQNLNTSIPEEIMGLW